MANSPADRLVGITDAIGDRAVRADQGCFPCPTCEANSWIRLWNRSEAPEQIAVRGAEGEQHPTTGYGSCHSRQVDAPVGDLWLHAQVRRAGICEIPGPDLLTGGCVQGEGG